MLWKVSKVNNTTVRDSLLIEDENKTFKELEINTKHSVNNELSSFIDEGSEDNHSSAEI